ncbi:hypothetical protein GCM10009759_66060 [Kitasatospora saccharophila]|uniref:Tetratricopeptide repeat protein n=1 Tax=Kitasatospora saccharophila TaxID=407973 RepID=A0ABN2XXP3_9ACTN
MANHPTPRVPLPAAAGTPTRRPNARLRALLQEARWSGDALAAAVNAVGRENGLDLRYRRPSVAQWLAGSVPRDPVPPLVAEAFSRRLHRGVTAEELGFAPRHGLPGPRRGRPSADAGAPRANLPYRLSALAGIPDRVTGTEYLRVRSPGPTRLVAPHVQAAGKMLALLSRVDHQLGAGAVREQATAYFELTVRPWLGLPGTDAHRRALLQRAAGLAYLCGFANFDEWRHGEAQHWYRLSAALADEAADARALALALRALSVQALELGHPGPALDLAEAALRAGRHLPDSRAFLLGQYAVALAARARPGDALRAVEGAEDALPGATASAATGRYHGATLAYQRGEVHRRLGDIPAAVSSLRASVRLRPGTERRSQALVHARLAETLAARGQLEAACASWQEFVDLRARVASARVERAADRMRSVLLAQRHRGEAERLLAALRVPER